MGDLASVLPEEPVADGVVELRLIRVVPAGDLSHRSSDTAFLAAAPEYRFAIHRAADGLRVGRIHVRTTEDPTITSVLGHMGYAVDEEHRRLGYASRAIRLLADITWRAGQQVLWVLIESENVPSRRAVERAGFVFVDEVDTSPMALALGLGPRMCRYSAQAPGSSADGAPRSSR